MNVKLLTEHHFEFLSLKGDFTGSSESALVKMPHCWKSHVLAHMILNLDLWYCYFQHMSSLQQALIPEIEERLRKKCENLLITHDLENSTGWYLCLLS